MQMHFGLSLGDFQTKSPVWVLQIYRENGIGVIDAVAEKLEEIHLSIMEVRLKSSIGFSVIKMILGNTNTIHFISLINI